MGRLQLQSLLEELLGSNKVHFQPPATILLSYPCIVYTLDYAVSEFADNDPYKYSKRYQVTVIDRDPDSIIPDKLAKQRLCTLNRAYQADSLNHFVFNIYF